MGRAPGLPSPAGLWRWPDGNFQSGVWRQKKCQWCPFQIRTGRCRHQNRPRRPRKNVRLTQNPQPFWEIPSPLYIGSLGHGARGRAQPRGCLYKYMCKREKRRPQRKNACSGEKNWGEPRDSLVESPIYSGQLLAQGVMFQLGELFFRGEDFAIPTGRGGGSRAWRTGLPFGQSANWAHTVPSETPARDQVGGRGVPKGVPPWKKTCST